MSALASEIGTGAVSPPDAETCIRTECPFRYSEKYSRVPSVTSDRFEAPSFVICKDEVTAGAASAGLIRNIAATNPATAMKMKPAASQGAILAFPFAGV